MNFNICPSCLAENAETAVRCHACGHLLGDDTIPSPLDHTPTQLLPGGLWLDDLGQPPAAPAPAFKATMPADFTITLRNVPAPGARATPARPQPPAPAPLPPVVPELKDAVPFPVISAPAPADLPTLTSEVTLPAARATPPKPAAPPPPLPRPLPRVVVPPPEPPVAREIERDPAADAVLDAKRAARRASVRRSRLRSLAAQPHGDEPPLVLVLDRDDVERGVLCTLLQGFGFATHEVTEAPKAAQLLGQHRFTAVFADIAVDGADGGAGIELARLVRTEPEFVLFVLVTRPLSPVDKVRAQLAGFEAILTKRVTRGSVAGVLDGNGIALPSDARRRT